MRKKKDLHLFLILSTAEAYLSNAREEGLTDEPIHIRIITGIKGWLKFRRLDDAELRYLVALSKEEYLEKLKNIEVSHVVYALELIRLAREDYDFAFGIGKKHLLKGRGTFIMGMIKKKRDDPEKHAELKAIIDESVVVAKQFYGYTQNCLKGA